MRTVKVNLKERSYSIIIGNNIFNTLGSFIHKLNIGMDAYIITNSLVKSEYGMTLQRYLKKWKINSRFKLIADTEMSKSIEVTLSLIKDIANYDRSRATFIIAFGGGVVGDLTGFIASIYKRGVPYIQLPTTLLAQIDSSIGGKTAIDLKQGKNLVGAFYQPRLVLSDVACLNTLNLRQMRSGLAEAIKYGIIKDNSLFNKLEKDCRSLLSHDEVRLETLVYRCSKIKAAIIERDEREEKGIRTILNFGHTLGHAIESASSYRGYNHGEAIGIGMLCASDISKRLGFIREGLFKRIENIIRIVGLPIKIKDVSISRIIEAHYRDKKFLSGGNRFVLIKGLGLPFTKKDIPLGLIKAVLRARI